VLLKDHGHDHGEPLHVNEEVGHVGRRRRSAFGDDRDRNGFVSVHVFGPPVR
jgi:hypothetical protein